MGDEDDSRVIYLHKQVVSAFRNVPIEKLNEYWKTENVIRTLYDFLDNPDTEGLFVREAKGGIEVSTFPQKAAKGGTRFGLGAKPKLQK